MRNYLYSRRVVTLVVESSVQKAQKYTKPTIQRSHEKHEKAKKEHAVGVKMYPSMCQIYVFFLFDILLKARKLLCFVNTIHYENAVKKKTQTKKTWTKDR